RLDVLAVGADPQRPSAEEGLRAVDVGRVRGGDEGQWLAREALLEGVDDLLADRVGHADDGEIAGDHAFDQLWCAPQADRQVRLRIVAVLQELIVVIESLGDLVGRDADDELAVGGLVDEAPALRPPIEVEIEPDAGGAAATAGEAEAALAGLLVD